MLAKKFRGLSREEISEVVDKGRTFSNRFFRVFVGESDADRSQFAVVMPHKVYRKATQRTAMRRLIFDAVGRVYEAWTTPRKIVILAKSSAHDLDKEGVCFHVADVMSKGALI
jgi:ribonuclease P protein component